MFRQRLWAALPRARASVLCLIAAAAGCQEAGLTKFNNDPDATIRSPSSRFVYGKGVVFSASGSVDDDDHATEDLVARWYVDGEKLCETDVLEDGETACELVALGDSATIRLEVEDPLGAVGAQELELSGFDNQPPMVVIERPIEGGQYYEDQKVQFAGVVSDPDHDYGEGDPKYQNLNDLKLTVASDVDGELEIAVSSASSEDAYASFVGSMFLTKGDHVIRAEVVDSYGETNDITQEVTITVGGPNNDPTCQITAPDPELAVAVDESVVFVGTVLDMDLDPSDYASNITVTWVSSLDGVLGPGEYGETGQTVVPIESLRRGTHLITLQAEDDVGGRCADVITLEVGNPPTLSVLEPEEGAVYGYGEPMVFRAIVSDGEDSAIEIDMKWETTDDGRFSEQGADSTGVVEFAADYLRAGPKTLTVTATDSGGLWTSELVSFTINELPSAPTIQLTTETDAGCFGTEIYTSDTLLACITEHSVDPDGDPVTYTYDWYRDGFIDDTLADPTVSSMDTARGETWRVVVTPSDSLSAGPFAQSTITIRNTAPFVEDVSLSPADARTADDITCNIGALTDPDSDEATYSYLWTVNGVSVGTTEATLPASSHQKGDEIVCTVTPSDDSDVGPATASPILTIGNTAPSVAEAIIIEEYISTGDTLNCTHSGFSDVDGADEPDETFYRWTVNGILVTEGPTLYGGFSGGDVIACQAIPFDGEDEGALVEVTTEVSNSSPTIDAVIITPTGPTAVDSLTCAWEGFEDADEGDVDLSTSVWTVDGLEVGTGTTLAGVFSGGQLVSCTVSAYDGTSYGTTLSTSVMVLNTPPTADSAVLTPDPATVVDDITCSAVGYADPDIYDVDESIFSWTVNGIPTSTEPTLTEGFVGGDEVQCMLTPFDGTTYGTPLVASQVITNTPATVDWVTLSPSSAKADDPLTCVWAEPVDPDGHTLFVTAEWTVNGEFAGNGEALTTGYGAADEVTCSVSVHDGFEDGPVTSASITIENTLPSIDGVAIVPNPAKATDPLTCSWSGYFDIDGDPDVSIATWAINGLFVGVGPTLPSGYLGADVVSCTVIPSDGRDTAGAIIDTVVISNSAPAVDTVTVYPLAAMVGDELTCGYSGYSDVDGNPDSSTYTWFINEVEAGTGETLLGGFAGGDTIRCQVNPYDGMDWGDPVSGSQTISNSAPSIESVAIDPADPQTDELVTCSWDGYSDPDGHPDASLVEWFVNDVSVATGTTISSDFTAGDDLKCVVTPHDSFEPGAPKSLSVTVSNAPPQIATVYILPTEPKAETPVTCNWMGYYDPEGDPDMSTIVWTINGVEAGTGSILSSGYVHGDDVSCEVTPNDGMDEGVPVEAGVSVDNTLPVISGLSIDPSPAYRTQELTCQWDEFTDPDGEPDLTTVEWEVNDAPMGAGTTLAVGLVNEGDTVRCTAIAHDGTDEGNTMGVLITVSESVPSIEAVSIEPFPAYKDSYLECGWEGYFDADGDPDASFVVWTVNGVVASTDTDISEAYVAGDVVVCEVSPYDGQHIGIPKSATVTIANAPPIVHSVTLLPEPAYDGAPLNCMPGFTTDVDGTTTFSFRYKWYVEGSEVPGETTDNLPPGFFSKDQIVKCAASASDGTDFGGYQESLEKYVLNTAPHINSVSIGPADAQTNDTISASVDTTDIDGDSLTLYYDWYVSGELVSTFATLDGATYFDKNEPIYLEVSASDGEDESVPFGSNTIIINNTPATGPTVTVTPEDPVTGAEVITCTMAGEGDDEDGDDLTYTYSWLRDGAPWEGATSTTLEPDDTIEAENLKSYEIWTCLITPNDGDEDGSPGSDSAEVQTIFSGWDTVDVNLGDVDLKIHGEDNKDYSGRGVAWAGDVDGDDRTDILVAAPDNDDVASSAGKVYLLQASDYDGYSEIPLNDVSIAWTGSGAGHNLGGYVQSKAMSTAGDLDGDELDDFIIGEPLFVNSSTGGTDGRAYIILSASISATGPVTIPSITTADYIIDGRAYSQLGHAVAMVGDLDGRGQGDILIGGPSANGGRGEAYLLYGEDFGVDSTLDMDVDAAVTFTGEAPGDDAGLRFTSVGDVDADGVVDILIAAPSNDVGGETKSGRSYLFTAASIVSTEHNLSADAEWLFNGEDSNDLSGHAMAQLGDLDKDGYGDFMISGKGQDTFGSNSGLVYVINGGDLPIFRTFNLEEAWFKIGGEAAGDRAGHDLSYAGDVDADGRGDLLISAYANDAGGSSAGRTYLVLGASIPAGGGSMTLSDTDFAFTGESLADSSGYSIAGNGDFDADGLSDFLIGAYLRDSTASDAGTTYMAISPSVYH